MKINKKAGYEITRKPFEPTSLFRDGNTPEGDVSDCTVDFETGDTDQLESGDTLSTLFGKIKFFINSVVNKFLPLGGTTGQVLKKASDENYDVEWADEEGGSGLPTGGTTGQVLKKASDDNYDVEWGDESGGSSLPSGGKSGDVLTKTGAGDDAVAWREQFPQITFGDEKNIIITGKSPINNTYRLWYWDEEEQRSIEVPVTISNFRYDATEHKIKFTMGNPSENNYNYGLDMSIYRLLVNRIYDSSEEAYVPIEGTAVSPITSVETDVIDGNYVGGFQQAFVGLSFYFNLELQSGATIDMEIPITGINNLVDTENKVSVITQGVMPSPNNSSNKLYLASYYGYAFWSTVEQGSQLPTQGGKGWYLEKTDDSWSSNACSWKQFKQGTITPFVELFKKPNNELNICELSKISPAFISFTNVSSNTGQGYIDYILNISVTSDYPSIYSTGDMIIPATIFGTYENTKLACSKVSGDVDVNISKFEVVDSKYILLNLIFDSLTMNTQKTITLRFSNSDMPSSDPCYIDFTDMVNDGYYLSITKTYRYTPDYPKYEMVNKSDGISYEWTEVYRNEMSGWGLQPVITLDDANHEITVTATNTGEYGTGFQGYLKLDGYGPDVPEIVSISNPDFNANFDYLGYIYIEVPWIMPNVTATAVITYNNTNIFGIDTNYVYDFRNTIFVNTNNQKYGIPSGGSQGQVLKKSSTADGVAVWGDGGINLDDTETLTNDTSNSTPALGLWKFNLPMPVDDYDNEKGLIYLDVTVDISKFGRFLTGSWSSGSGIGFSSPTTKTFSMTIPIDKFAEKMSTGLDFRANYKKITAYNDVGTDREDLIVIVNVPTASNSRQYVIVQCIKFNTITGTTERLEFDNQTDVSVKLSMYK